MIPLKFGGAGKCQKSFYNLRNENNNNKPKNGWNYFN